MRSRPHANPPAGGDMIFVVLVAGFLPTFGFIVATTVGCTAGSRDLTEGMFRHLVVTGRSRLALYLARIPAGLAIVVPLAAIGYTIVCAVCVLAAPTFIDDSNVNIPPGLSRAGFENWARDRAEPVICSLPYNGHIPGLTSRQDPALVPLRTELEDLRAGAGTVTTDLRQSELALGAYMAANAPPAVVTLRG